MRIIHGINFTIQPFMKKTFSFTHPKKQRPRVADAIKHELKKYIKRERNKKLPENVDFWDFDCRFGATEASSGVIHVSEINKVISEADVEGLDEFFLEVLSKPAKRSKKPVAEKSEELEEPEENFLD